MTYNKRSNPSQEVEDDDHEHDEWHPTEVAFEQFRVRDLELATQNLYCVLENRGSYSMRDLKDSMLHSVDTIEKVLATKIAEGKVLETRGRYTLS